MTTEEFVRELAKCAPDISDMVQRGLSPKFAKEYRDSFICKPKPHGHKLDDPLLNLLSLYEVSHVEVGLLHFLSQAEEIPEGWIVAEVESDPVILDKRTHELFAEEYGAPGHILWECARDSGSFLGALAEAGCFRHHRPDIDEKTDQRERCAQARKCAEIAGGEKYLDFHEMLLGCD